MNTSVNTVSGLAPSIDVKAVAQEATRLLASAIGRILDGGGNPTAEGEGPQTRMLFPNGIELIYLGFKVGTDINISLAVAGKEAPVKVPVVVAAASGANVLNVTVPGE